MQYSQIAKLISFFQILFSIFSFLSKVNTHLHSCLKSYCYLSIYVQIPASIGEGSGTPLQYYFLENPMDRGAWWATVHRVSESDMTEQLHFPFSLSCIGEGNGNPLQCSCLENPMDRGAWRATVRGVARVRHDLATEPPPPPLGFL